MADSQNVVIVGGAAIGSAVACHLAMHPQFSGSITVVEKDPTYAFCASALSAASIRQQFSSAVNIRISLHGVRALRDIGHTLTTPEGSPAIDLHEGGYLYLASAAGEAVLRANQARQSAEGADVLFLDPAALAARFAWLDLAGVACGTWGRTGEGWFDGWALLQAYRAKARALGVIYRQGEAAAYELVAGRVAGVRLKNGERLPCDVAVNAAGSGGARLAATAGVMIPVEARTRYVFTFTCKEEVSGCPLMIDMSGVYVRPEGRPTPEGQMFLCGVSPPPERERVWDDADPAAADVDWSLFEEIIWPALAARVPAFERIRPGRAWAGPYDMNLMDANAILGPAVGVPNLYLANGFSGHGLQQAPAVGRGLAEHIVHGAYTTLDLSDLGHARILAGRPLREANVI